MTTTAEKIAVMQACDSGEEIEVQIGGNWHPVSGIAWDWRTRAYRIKPKTPKVIWVNEYPSSFASFESAQEARKFEMEGCARTAVKYQEVIE